MAVHSDDYQQQLKQVHASNPERPWGTTGARNFGDYVVKFLEERANQITTVLDFGAGRGSLGAYVTDRVSVEWTNYDPGIPEYDSVPTGQFDLVVSSDVLEHIEPEHIDETLHQIAKWAKKAQFHHIACDASDGRLPDGRDMHLITEKLDWWLPKFDVDGWSVMYAAQCAVRKRGKLRNHCHVQVDRV